MKTKHKNAAHAKPKYIADPSSIYKLMNKLQPFTQSEITRLQIPPRIAFESMRNGQGTEHDYHTLAAVVNVALVSSEVIDDLCVQTARSGQEAMMRALARFRKLGKWGFDAIALQDLPVVLDLHEQLLEKCTPLQLQKAMNETIDRMNRGQVLV